jgi:hypothetical protein
MKWFLWICWDYWWLMVYGAKGKVVIFIDWDVVKSDVWLGLMWLGDKIKVRLIY